MSDSPFELDQADIAARIAGASYFADICVETLRPRSSDGFAEIQSRINAALSGLKAKAGKVGLATSVLMPFADTTAQVSPGPLMTVSTVVRVQELPLVNMGARGTQKSCEEAALKVVQLLHLFNSGRGYAFTMAPEFWTPTDRFAPYVTIDIRVEHQGGIAAPQKVARPTIAAAGTTTPQEVTLATATSAAALYYTTDGTLPSSANAAATLYAAPFTLAAAATLRVAAEKTGLTQSDATEQTFT